MEATAENSTPKQQALVGLFPEENPKEMEAYLRLSNQRRKFVDSLVENLMRDPGQAYLDAGYKCKPEHARKHASRLMKIDDIQAAVRARVNEASREAGVNLAFIIQELHRQFFLDVTELYYVDDEGNTRVKPPEEWPKGAGRAVTRFKGNTVNYFDKSGNRTHQVKDFDIAPPSKTELAKLLLKVHGVPDRQEQSGPGGGPINHQHDLNPVLKDLVDAVVP